MTGLLCGIMAWQLSPLIFKGEPAAGQTADIDYSQLIQDNSSEWIGRIPLNLRAIKGADWHGDSLSLHEMTGGKSAHILRYSAVGCYPCQEKAMKELSENASGKWDGEEIVVLVSEMHGRDLKVLQANLGNRYRFYSIKDLPYDTDDEVTSPLFFDTDSCGNISNFHIVTLDS